MKNDDCVRLVDRQKENRRYDSQFHFLNDNQLQYRSGLKTGCCTLGDNAALRCIIIWMCTVAVVVFIALVVKIISQEHQVQIGDIVTGHKNCSDIGAWVLSQGGNAVDAAVAAGFCIAVALPHLASLGGGGVLLLHQTRENKTTVVDFRELSPTKLQVQRYIDNPDIGRIGRASIATPGFVAGLKYARDKYGSHEVRSECCSWFDLLSQTVKLLDKGIPLPPNWNNLTADGKTKSDQLADFISSGGYSRFKSPYRDMMRTTLEEIISDPTSIYQGTLSHRIPHDLKDQVRQEDLSMYSVKERTPLSSWFSDYQVFTPPPPFSGAAVLGILNGLELIEKSSVHSLSKHPGDSNSKSEYSSKLYNIIERVLDEQEKLGDWDGELDEVVEEKGGDEPALPDEEPQQGGDEKKISLRDRTKHLINIKNAER
ncbi:uncharacterized protein LOC111697400 [Eurytemora carolleeae]|uniref:uncharacterized protein LOC111697400 n=1 Tax=Eurytemora carolleeae TaxID=1294199 RepID=UPI000C772FA7|nr:uncharacterized protein LOC111697400 [Eurytemora carolleeae]|eukprot:XP_023323180.1 uncharacterized protein LOC111697400 [Eurytemora affinis]